MDDDELLNQFQAHHTGLQPATKSLAASEPQDFAQQQQQQRQNYDSWAALGALGSHFEQPDSSAGPSAYLHDPRLSPDREQQQQQQDSYPPEGYSEWAIDDGFEQRKSGDGPSAYSYDPRLVTDYQQQNSDSPKAYSEDAADEGNTFSDACVSMCLQLPENATSSLTCMDFPTTVQSSCRQSVGCAASMAGAAASLQIFPTASDCRSARL